MKQIYFGGVPIITNVNLPILFAQNKVLRYFLFDFQFYKNRLNYHLFFSRLAPFLLWFNLSGGNFSLDLWWNFFTTFSSLSLLSFSSSSFRWQFTVLETHFCWETWKQRCPVVFNFFWGGNWGLWENLGVFYFQVLLHFYNQFFKVFLGGA